MRALLVLTMFLVLAGRASAQDIVVNKSFSVKVGETKELIVIGAHKPDCVTSVFGRVEIKSPPNIGAISQRDNVPYVVGTSMSGTCYGAHLVGTAVDYTGKASGRDSVRLDAVFPNGRAHYTISLRIQ